MRRDVRPCDVSDAPLRGAQAVTDLSLVPDASDGELELPPTREEQLEAIPLTVTVWDEVDLATADPALIDEGYDAGRRVCIATRRAGGRCTAVAPAHSLLCNAHSGRLDPRSGGLARAKAARDARDQAEEAARVGRLGTRGVVAAALEGKHRELKRAIEVLVDLAADGDRQAALALIPYMNQALGMPTERVQLEQPSSAADLASMGTAELQAYAAAARAKRAETA